MHLTQWVSFWEVFFNKEKDLMKTKMSSIHTTVLWYFVEIMEKIYFQIF